MLKKMVGIIFRKISEPENVIFPKRSDVNVADDFSIGKYRNIQINEGSSITIESAVCFREFCNILIYAKGLLTIHKNVFFNNYCSINCLGCIEIGENTLFGEGVKMYDHNHSYGYDSKGDLIVERNSFKIGHIKIGKNCWIGSNVTILNNVEIGDNVIIGANNLICKSIPSNTIVKSKVEQIIEGQ